MSDHFSDKFPPESSVFFPSRLNVFLLSSVVVFFLRVATNVCRHSNACVQFRDRLSFEILQTFSVETGRAEGGGRF